ncbi:MAG: mannose-1-phosphate guanylyltransferase/mannose-6-phosphate isomerase [Pseudomonadota bacterium]
MAKTIIPVLLCGGSGTRLWPLSRKSYPKQFVQMIGEGSLFQQAALRLSGKGFAAPMIVTNADFRFIATQQLSEIGVDPGAVLIEPEARNTAPALLAAALVASKQDPDALILAAASDHFIEQAEVFRATVMRGAEAAARGDIVTFGITPDRPETGYGYLELDGTDDTSSTVPLKRFVEKPEVARAEEMLKAGTFMWNSGIFLYSAKTLVDAFAAHAPEMMKHVQTSVNDAETDLGFLRLAQEPWSRCEDISIDYAIMEKVSNLSVVVHKGDWSDLGGWEALREHGAADGNGVVTSGPVTAQDCSNSLLRSESAHMRLVALGLEDVVAVAMQDAVLVARRDRAQDVGKLVKEMRKEDVRQADTFPVDHRPWGFFETLTLGGRFQVKRIVVNAGAALSLQSHMHRSEHWIVVAGTARVTVDDDVILLAENQSVYIPLGAKHRLENPGKVPMELIEVQTGVYLGEDDIVRYEDIYARKDGPKG